MSAGRRRGAHTHSERCASEKGLAPRGRRGRPCGAHTARCARGSKTQGAGGHVIKRLVPRRAAAHCGAARHGALRAWRDTPAARCSPLHTNSPLQTRTKSASTSALNWRARTRRRRCAPTHGAVRHWNRDRIVRYGVPDTRQGDDQGRATAEAAWHRRRGRQADGRVSRARRVARLLRVREKTRDQGADARSCLAWAGLQVLLRPLTRRSDPRRGSTAALATRRCGRRCRACAPCGDAQEAPVRGREGATPRQTLHQLGAAAHRCACAHVARSRVAHATRTRARTAAACQRQLR